MDEEDDYIEAVTLQHHEWERHGTHTLTLKCQPGGTYNAWQVRHHHAYAGGGGFGFNSNMYEEEEARAYFARKLAEEQAKHEEWLAEQAEQK